MQFTAFVMLAIATLAIAAPNAKRFPEATEKRQVDTCGPLTEGDECFILNLDGQVAAFGHCSGNVAGTFFCI